MRQYEAPKIQMISRGNLDIICTSEFLFPIIPLTDVQEENNGNQNM